jgi:hypothetical protein
VSGVASELTPPGEVSPPTVTYSCASDEALFYGNCVLSVYLTSYDPNTSSIPVGNVKQYEVSNVSIH